MKMLKCKSTILIIALLVIAIVFAICLTIFCCEPVHYGIAYQQQNLIDPISVSCTFNKNGTCVFKLKDLNDNLDSITDYLILNDDQNGETHLYVAGGWYKTKLFSLESINNSGGEHYLFLSSGAICLFIFYCIMIIAPLVAIYVIFRNRTAVDSKLNLLIPIKPSKTAKLQNQINDLQQQINELKQKDE